MLTATSQARVQIEGKAMILAKQLLLTTPAGAQDLTSKFVSGSPDESTQTDMPSGTRAVVGYPSRALDFTITDADGMFDPNNEASPLFGAEMHYLPVTYLEGLYPAGSQGVPEMFVKFTGSTHSWKRNSSAETVSFTCLDGRDRLRGEATLPAVVTAPPYNAGLTAEFAVDALLRSGSQGAISSWPAQRPRCLFAAGMRTSIWPEVGTLVGANLPPSFVPGKWGSALSGTAAVSALAWTLSANVGLALYVEMTVGSADPTTPLQAGIGSGAEGVVLNVYSNKITVTSGASTATWTKAVGTGFRTVKMVATLPATGATAVTGTLYLDDGSSHAFTLAMPSPRVSLAWAQLILVLPAGSTVEALQITRETAPTISFTFTPAAVLDPSLNVLQAVPATSGDPWSAIQQIADAEQAVAGFDENGVFRFKNRVTLRTSPSVRTVTAGNLLPLDPESDSSAKATRVQVGYTSWQFTAGQTVWAATTAWSFPAKAKTTRTVEMDTLVAALDMFPDVLPYTGTPTPGASYYRASIDAAGSKDHPGGFTVTLTQVTSSKIAVTVNNGSSIPVVFVATADHIDIPAGTPVFQIGGTLASAGTEVLIDAQWPPLNADGTGGAASNPAGELLQQVTGNPWIQDNASASTLSVDLLSQLHRAPILLQNVQIVPPDVRLQLGDRITLIDPVSGINEPVTIWGQSRELSGGSGPGDPLTYTHTVDARMVSGRFKGWILGVAGRSTMGVTTRL